MAFDRECADKLLEGARRNPAIAAENFSKLSWACGSPIPQDVIDEWQRAFPKLVPKQPGS
jgi:hypothetical protein